MIIKWIAALLHLIRCAGMDAKCMYFMRH